MKVATVTREALSNLKFDFVITENCLGGPGLLHIYLYYLIYAKLWSCLHRIWNITEYWGVICFSKSSWFPSSELFTFLPIFLKYKLLTWITLNLACISGNASSSQCNLPYVCILPCNLSLCLSYLSSMTFYFLVFQLPLCAVPFTSDIYVNIQVS